MNEVSGDGPIFQPVENFFGAVWKSRYNNLYLTYNGCTIFLFCQDRDFRKRPSVVRRLPTIFRSFPNVAENIRRCSDDLWALPNLFKMWQFQRVVIQLGQKSTDSPFLECFWGNWFEFFLSIGFVSKVWCVRLIMSLVRKSESHACGPKRFCLI